MAFHKVRLGADKRFSILPTPLSLSLPLSLRKSYPFPGADISGIARILLCGFGIDINFIW